VDLLVAGSRAEAREGRVMLSSQSQNAIDGSSAPVLVVARGVALDFGALVAA
jgi:nucleotide-binding universal stress UspA family protein